MYIYNTPMTLYHRLISLWIRFSRSSLESWAMVKSKQSCCSQNFSITIWLFNIAMENPR